MRLHTITLAGQGIDLALSFDAASELAAKIADPLFIAREAGMEAQMQALNLSYDPKWKPNVSNVPQIVFIGQKCAGGERTLKDIQGLVFEHGLIGARDIALNYIGALVMPSAEEKPVEESDTPPGE